MRRWIGREFRDRSLIDKAIQLVKNRWGDENEVTKLLMSLRDDPFQKAPRVSLEREEFSREEYLTLAICLELREVLASDIIDDVAIEERSGLCEVVERATNAMLVAARGLQDEWLVAAALRLSVGAFYYRYDFEKAYERSLEAARVYRSLCRMDGELNVLAASAYAVSLNRCANSLGGLHRSRPAIRFLRLAIKVFEVIEERVGQDISRDLAMVKHNLVNLLINLDQFEEAEPLAAESLAVYRRLQAEQPKIYSQNLAQSLINQSKILRLLGRESESVKAAKEATHRLIDLETSFPKIFRFELALSYHQLSLCLRNVGRLKAARRCSRKACLCIVRQDAGEQTVVNFDVAHAFQQWANCLTDTKHYPAALKIFEQALQIYEKVSKVRGELDLEAYARCLNEQSLLMFNQGMIEDSIHSAQQSYDLYLQLNQSGDQTCNLQLAITAENLGARHFGLGRKSEALRLARKSLKFYRATGLANDDEAIKYAGALLNFSTFLSEVKLFKRALPPVARAVKIAREITDKNPSLGIPELARILTNYTTRLRECGKSEQAIEAGRKATAIYRKLAETDAEKYSRRLVASLNNLAASLIEGNHHQEGVVILDEAIDLSESNSTHRTDQGLWLADRFQLSFNKALYSLREGPNGYPRALDALGSATKLSDQYRLSFRGHDQRKRIQRDSLSSRHWHLLVCTALWIKSGKVSLLDEAFEAGENLRGRGLNDLLAEEMLSRQGDEEFKGLLHTYLKAERRLGDLESTLAIQPSMDSMRRARERKQSEFRLGSPDTEPELPSRTGEIHEMRRELAQLEARIQTQSPDWNPRATVPSISAEQLKGALSEKTGFLQLTLIQGGLHALLLLQGKDTICVNTPAQEMILVSQIATRWQKLISDMASQSKNKRALRNRFDQLVSELGRFLPEKLREALLAIRSDIDHLIICPNGPLHLLPLHLCQIGEGTKIGETFQTTYSPSGAAYCIPSKKERNPRTEVYLASAAEKNLVFDKLESHVISGLFDLEGFAAGEVIDLGHSKKAMAQCAVFSFSGHAFFDRSHPIRSGLRLPYGPLTIAHFLEDRLLPNCEVAVLNGCESGFMQPDETDDFVSLPAALLYSGAKSVISTLWPISDLSGCFFGIKFHEALRDGRTIQESFCKAVGWLKGEQPGTAKSKEEFLQIILPTYLEEHANEKESNAIMKHASELLSHLSDNEAPFAHPLHWAPYVLHGKGDATPFSAVQRRGDDSGSVMS